MEITFYTNNSEDTVAVKNLTTLYTLTGTLKEECSIVDPVVTVESSNVIKSTYAYIPAFERYYFTEDPVNLGNHLWRIKMHCDVLSSWLTHLKNCDCVMERQEFAYNLYIPDEKIVTQGDTFTVARTLKNGKAFTNSKVVLVGTLDGHWIDTETQPQED